MTQARDRRGRFAARAGQVRGIVARKGRAGGAAALRNMGTIAASTGRSIAGMGVRVTPRGGTQVADRTVGRGTARTVARKVSAQKLKTARDAYRKAPPAVRRGVTRGHRRYLGPMV